MKVLKVIAGVVVLGAAVWFWFFPTYHHRYKMTVEIESDGKVYAGTGIVDVTTHSNGPIRIAHTTALSSTARGEAATISLGKRGVLLALIEPGMISSSANYMPRPLSGKDIALCAYYGERWTSDEKDKSDSSEARIRSIATETGVRQLPLGCYPALVWLANPSAQESAIPVPPDKLSDVLGTGTTLRSIAIEITTAPFSGEIYNILPWLRSLEAKERKRGVGTKAGEFKISSFEILGWIWP